MEVKIGKMLLPKLQTLCSAVMVTQEDIKDGDFKAIMDAGKDVYDACEAENSRLEEALKQNRHIDGRLIYILVENIVAVILRDEPWENLTICRLKELIAEKSKGFVVPSKIGDDVLKTIMKKQIAEIVKLKDEKQARKRKRKSKQEEEFLFPIYRR